ncbi:hypothetical protein EDC04DRAFT_2598161 [Pisolithus marmoratus]|nr:hypothetical protein EDC04DRAFT_2598161 [Pisolithus marmoratus]
MVVRSQKLYQGAAPCMTGLVYHELEAAERSSAKAREPAKSWQHTGSAFAKSGKPAAEGCPSSQLWKLGLSDPACIYTSLKGVMEHEGASCICGLNILDLFNHPSQLSAETMRVSLDFHNADGFGEWRILIGTSAMKKLRDYRINDTKKFKIVYKKIKELSNGQFSEENQKRLDGAQSRVPIFEAYVQRDLKLVYQIDCVPDYDGRTFSLTSHQAERQVVRIYGIYTHIQLDDVWGAMSHHLSSRGEEYIRRNKPVHPGYEVYLPAVFPLEVHNIIVKSPPLVLGDQEMDRLHSLLVLDKYVTFSQALLNGLRAIVLHDDQANPQERKIVECTTSCYVLGRSGTGKTTTMLFKMLGIQRAWQLHSDASDMPQPRQIFVTKSYVLANKVEEYFVKLLESLSLAGYTLAELARLKSRPVDRGLVDNDDVPDTQSGIPQRYSELESRHFPLFLTFDRLARMIAADISDADHPEAKRISKLFMLSHDPVVLDSFVSYEVFVNMYWPHFAQYLTKGRDPWLVFGEIMGIIRGSEKSLEFDDGSLDKKTYCGLPSRSNPTFSGQRESVYAIYEAYSKLKRQRQHHDVADRYVDEAQDNLLIDALLLKLLCNNPKGLFWAGDTAQTISAGSSFRFDDLKAFLYRIEVEQALHTVEERAVTPSESFQLAINYRSHSGIVNCAHSVIELISHFWPNSIDSLQPEHGIVDGLKPVFFTGRDKDTVHYEQFFFGAPGSHIEFGAQQCILVRNERAKEKLRQQVLLYNFFEDSNVDLSLALVLAVISVVAGGHNERRLQAPSFERDESRYAGLKLLYVGITRARKRLWIVDKSDKAEPMKLFWTSRSQIQNFTTETGVPHFAASSTAEEWAESGHSLFQHKRYTQAMHCFRRANMPRAVRIAEAYHFRELARATMGIALLTRATGREKLQYYRTAAECYIRAAENCKAADAYMNAEEYELAAKCYRQGRQDDEKPPSPLFRSIEEELEFLDTYGLDVALVVLYESHGRYVEAAELHLSEDRPLDAIRLFLKDKTNQHAVRRAADTILLCLWKHCSFGVSPRELHDGILKTLISLSHRLPMDLLSPRVRNEIKMFQTAAAKELDRITLEMLAETFIEQKENAAALWCLNHVFSSLPELLSATLDEFALFLRKFYTYSHLFYTVASHNDPVGGRGIRKLFGITQLSDDQYVIQAGSFILTTPSAVSTSDGELTNALSYTHGQITNALKERVRLHLRGRVDAETRLCHNSRVFSQCLLHITNSSCKNAKCEQQHVPLSSLDSAQYNARVGLHLQQMRILQLVYSAFPETRECKSIKEEIAHWIAHLYEAFFPPARAQGSLGNLDWSNVQRAPDGVRVMRNWLRNAIYSLEPRDSANFLTDILRLIKLSSAFGESDALQHADCVRRSRPKMLFRHPDCYIVADMIDSAQSFTESSISAGVLGLRHIIRNDLQEVLSAYVITLRLKNNPGADSLHDVVLPRSWMIRNNKLDARKDVRLIDQLLDDIENLWLMHTNVTPIHRSMFIARMMLCLASHNCPPNCVGLKAKISTMITHLRSNDLTRLTPSIYRRYTEATREDYLRVVAAYDESVLFPILFILSAREQGLGLALLASPLILARSSRTMEAPASMPQLGISPQAKPAQADMSAGTIPAAQNVTAAGKEESAARLIQRIYRQHRQKQKRLLERTTLEAESSAIFVSCLKHARASGLARGFYRLLYLGPLPHLLLVLNKGITIATSVKATTKIPGRLLSEGHEHLEELGRQRSEISSTLKQGRELRKKLSPDSVFHKNSDVSALVNMVMQVKEFLHRIPGEAPEELNTELGIAFKAIVVE